MENLIEVSDSAVDELKNQGISKDEFLRIALVEGGCSGLSYQLHSDTVATAFDTVLFEDDQINVVTDKQSLQHLRGLRLDYSSDLINVGFRFHNPNAVETCGCGHSMKV